MKNKFAFFLSILFLISCYSLKKEKIEMDKFLIPCGICERAISLLQLEDYKKLYYIMDPHYINEIPLEKFIKEMKKYNEIYGKILMAKLMKQNFIGKKFYLDGTKADRIDNLYSIETQKEEKAYFLKISIIFLNNYYWISDIKYLTSPEFESPIKLNYKDFDCPDDTKEVIDLSQKFFEISTKEDWEECANFWDSENKENFLKLMKGRSQLDLKNKIREGFGPCIYDHHTYNITLVR